MRPATILTGIAAAVITVVGSGLLDHDRRPHARVDAVRPAHAAQLHPRPGHADDARHVRRDVRVLRPHPRLGRRTARRGDFVPHLSITVALALVLVDLGVLVYFIHHVAKSIQLPEVIAGIARDLSTRDRRRRSRRVDGADSRGPLVGRRGECSRGSRTSGVPVAATQQRLPAVRRATRRWSPSRPTPRRSCELLYRPGHFVVEGLAARRVWPADAAADGRRAARAGARHGRAPDAAPGPRVRDRPARRDRDPRARRPR